jgi:acid phosphatase family membrane protein YuiD
VPGLPAVGRRVDKPRGGRHHRAWLRSCALRPRPRLRAALKEDATQPFWIALIVGFVVQGYKGVAAYFGTGRWNLRRFVETGGMPSSHSAAVAALTTAVGLQEGFTSALFGVTLYFSLIVMYDAAGLRRAAGRHAAVLNRLIDRHFQHPEDDTQKLMELLGHTPFEVLIGGLLGVLSALLWDRVHPL